MRGGRGDEGCKGGCMANPRFHFHQRSPSSAAAMMPVKGGTGKAACFAPAQIQACVHKETESWKKTVRQLDMEVE
jgi:hypothetical protein